MRTLGNVTIALFLTVDVSLIVASIVATVKDNRARRTAEQAAITEADHFVQWAQEVGRV